MAAGGKRAIRAINDAPGISVAIPGAGNDADRDEQAIADSQSVELDLQAAALAPERNLTAFDLDVECIGFV